VANKNKGYKNKPFRRWISRFPCSVSGCTHNGGVYHEDVGEWLCDPHHVDEVGMGGNTSRPDVGNMIPLCRWDHTLSKNSIHNLGDAAFQDKHDIRIHSEARRYGMLWKTKIARERTE
jgi:hypothetical protein